MQKPSIGRIVHYQPMHIDRANGVVPAIITKVLDEDGLCDLFMFSHSMNQMSPTNQYPFSETPEPGHWNWPPQD